MVKACKDMTRDELIARIKGFTEKCRMLTIENDNLSTCLAKYSEDKKQLQDDTEVYRQMIKKLEERIVGLESDLKAAAVFKDENERLWKRNGKYHAMITKLLEAMFLFHQDVK